ncbi:hypothetical protein EDB81DRAFT_667826 [Dactylonectria macrodidyma]|uniref:HNH nuclease domain-containing protein n=1 Tax=Dactylonectria macrodidyma TaxID=307937 RepID=A0A9P9IE97_9HYPO|nr:hypothetical protein EDB81DRAFT_667826 [Dactylonectria macrodidyma]
MNPVESGGPALSLKRRRPAPAPQANGVVFFLHPGYPDSKNVLLSLPALDSGGIHHETARIACAILADCNWNGFFSLTRDGPRLPAGSDDILTQNRYYFRIEGDDKYPIVPSFDNFRCPSSLPPSWSDDSSAPIQTTLTHDVGKRDQTCRITGSLIPNETAHIIPAAQSDWWVRNNMFAYTRPQSFDTRCASNTILLRRDLHKMWDDHHFCIVPKAGEWVVHMLWDCPTVELQDEYHNLELQPLRGVSRYFLLCRFALATLSHSVFLNQLIPRKLVTVTESGPPQVHLASADECRRLFNNRTNSRTPSPKKRQRSAQGEPEDAEDSGTSSGSELETQPESSDEDEPKRGRPRKRRWSPEMDDVLAGYRRHDDSKQKISDQVDSGDDGDLSLKRLRPSDGCSHLQTPPRSTTRTKIS